MAKCFLLRFKKTYALIIGSITIYFVYLVAYTNITFNRSGKNFDLVDIRERNFSGSRRSWITINANKAKNDKFDSKVSPMVRHSLPIVPNIVHFIKFGTLEISFAELITLVAAFRNQDPDAIYIHCSLCANDTTISGQYWDTLLKYNAPVRVLHLPEPTDIFGHELANRRHATDVARLTILMEHGGIFLDNDLYLVNPLDDLLHYEMSLGWEHNHYLSNKILVAHRNARFLRRWYKSYHRYDGTRNNFNAEQLPTIWILKKDPFLVNRVEVRFGVRDLVKELHDVSSWDDWLDYYSVHLHLNEGDVDQLLVNELNEENIRVYDCAFGRMARLALYNSTTLWNPL